MVITKAKNIIAGAMGGFLETTSKTTMLT